MKTDAASAAGAIVLGGNFIGLGVARSLGRRGIPVWVFDRARSIAAFSRYTKRVVHLTEDVHDSLLRAGGEHHLEGWVIFPISDRYVEMVATNHRSLGSIYRLTTPPLEVTRFALDKRLTYRKASELGIATPWTLAVDRPPEEISRDLPYPVILKPALNHHFFPQTSLKALPVDTAADLQPAFDRMTKYVPPDEILIQERIPGRGETQFSLGAVCENGKAYATLVVRRTRQYPIDFGNTSSFVETVDQPVVEASGRKFLEGINFDGMAEVEFKCDPRDGQCKILDVNVRPWGWHGLGAAAGVDFCYLLWRQKVGLAVSSIQTRRSASWFRELNDFLAIARSTRRGTEIKRLLKALLSGRCTGASFDVLDPVPFFAEFAFRAFRRSAPRGTATSS